jgi:flagellin
MSRINTNVVSLTAQRNLATANAQVSTSLERLSTGLKINRGSDDPAGLIASERLRSEKVALQSAISNNVRAVNLLSTAEASLNEINGLLLDIQGLVDTAANSGGMTTEEVAANQLLLDEAVDSITRIANTAQFNGKKLLDGSLGGFTLTTDANAASATVTNINLGNATDKDVFINYDGTSTAATKATLFLDADHDANGDADYVTAATGVISVTGNLGTALVDLTGHAGGADIAARINAVTDQTGITASNAAAGVTLSSADYGASQFINVGLQAGAAFTLQDGDEGTLANGDVGTNITVEGVGFTTGTTDSNGVSVDGLTITVVRDNLQMVVTLEEAEAAADDESVLNVAGNGGATFQIGAEINSANQVQVLIQNVGGDHLGDTAALSTLKTGGAYELSAGSAALSTAADIVGEAITTVASLRGRLGAVQKNTLETQIRSLGSTLENITSAESVIRDTDFAEETANMTRAQILVQAGTSVLAMANSAPQNVLALLQ